MSISRRALMSAFAATTAVAGFAGKAAFAQASADPAVLEAMKRATRFMVEEAAVNGGYVWSYLPDFSRRWGELEASPTHDLDPAAGHRDHGAPVPGRLSRHRRRVLL